MLRFLAARVAVLLPTLLVIVTLSFFLMRVAPGGPFDADAQLEPEILENLRAAYDLDRPVAEQFGLYAGVLKRHEVFVLGQFARTQRQRLFDIASRHRANVAGPALLFLHLLIERAANHPLEDRMKTR